MLVTAKPTCVETNVTINLAWVKCNLQERCDHSWVLAGNLFHWNVLYCSGTGETSLWLQDSLQPSVGKTLALGAVPGNLLLLPEQKKTGPSARNEYASGTWLDPLLAAGSLALVLYNTRDSRKIKPREEMFGRTGEKQPLSTDWKAGQIKMLNLKNSDKNPHWTVGSV